MFLASLLASSPANNRDNVVGHLRMRVVGENTASPVDNGLGVDRGYRRRINKTA